LNDNGGPGVLEPGREGQTFAGTSLAARYASFVKLPHTLFALPFAGVGAVLASYAYLDRVSLLAVLWIVIAFTAARFTAMGFNRIADRGYDALNPRTRMRELPSGRLSLRQAWMAVAVAATLFVLAAWQLNPLCGMLAPVALVWVMFYSYTKRFTAWSHHVLGLALGIAPVGAYLAIAGEWPQPWYAPLVLAAGVMFWVAGFDVIYALQDIEFDRRERLHSIAAKHGARSAMRFARSFHFTAVLAFLAVGALRLFPVGMAYLGGVAVMAILLTYEHWVVRGDAQGTLDLKRIDRAFFRANVAISTSFLFFTMLDRLLAADFTFATGSGP
jgi:4-hydroxybenzoate polyprenyltransferase